MSHVFRLFLSAGPPGTVGAERLLPANERHRVERVLRLRAGAAIEIADCEGAVWLATVVGHGVVRLESLLAAASPPSFRTVRLALAGGRADVAVEKLVELGVERIGGLRTAAGPVIDRTDRWQRVARAAAEQSKRSRVALVLEPAALEDVVGPRTLMLSHEHEPETMDDALVRVPDPDIVLVGPPSGFTRAECDRVRAGGGAVATLGPFTLRSETAAVAGMAILVDRLRRIR